MEITTATRASEKAAKQIVKDLKEVLNSGICLEMSYWNLKSSIACEYSKFSIYEASINKLHTFNTWKELVLFYFDIMENAK
jgi:hypothetical protein